MENINNEKLFPEFFSFLMELEPFFTGEGNISVNISKLAGLIKKYAPVCKIDLLRLSESGRFSEYASWEDGADAAGRVLAVAQALGSFEVKEHEPQRAISALQAFVGERVGDGRRAVVLPVTSNGKINGAAYFELNGDFCGSKTHILQIAAFAVGVLFFNRRKIDEYEIQRWVLDEVMENMHTNVYVSDIDTDEILFMNREMRKLYNLEDPVGLTCWKALKKSESAHCAFCPVDALRKEKGENPTCVWEEEDKATGRMFEKIDSLMNWTDGRVVHFQQSIDITDARRLSREASYDDLTGLLNRRAGKEALYQAMAEARKEGKKLSACLYDVNMLKEVNDKFGHVEGDSMLTLIADTVRRNMGKKDFSLRLSGDEFIVVFYDCDKDAARNRMMEISIECQERAVKEGKSYEVGFCYGLVEISPDENPTVPEIITRADEEMYRYKRAFHQNRGGSDESVTYGRDNLYNSIAASTDDYVFVCNMPNNTFRFPKQMVEEFKLSGEVVVDAVSEWAGLMDKKDRAAFLADMRRIQQGVSNVHDMEYRVRNKDGRYVHLRCRGRVSHDDAGAPMLFAGTITHICDDSRAIKPYVSEYAERERENKRRQYDTALKISFNEMYECDLACDTISLILKNDDVFENVKLTGCMSDYVKTFASECVHPQDRHDFLEFYSPDNMRRKLLCGETGLYYEFRRMGADGAYKWASSTIVPLPGEETCGVILILVKDISAVKNAEKERMAQKARINYVFRRTYDWVFQVNLNTGEYEEIVKPQGMFLSLSPRGKYGELNSYVVQNLVMPCDCDLYESVLGPKAILEGPRKDDACQFRITGNEGNTAWIEARVHYTFEDEPVAIVATRDVTPEKERELESHIAEQYAVALKNIYSELYEFNVSRNRYKIIHNAQGKHVTPPDEGELSEMISSISKSIVHPDERERFLRFFDIEAMRKAFISGCESLIGEFRVLWLDGSYHWESLTVLPVSKDGGGDEIILCFVMDIDQKKKNDYLAEQNRILKQQQLTDERYRIIVERTGTMVFEWNRESKTRYIQEELKRTFEGVYDGRDLIDIWREDCVIHPDDVRLFGHRLKEVQGGAQYVSMKVRLKKRRRGFAWCNLSMTCVRDGDGPARIIGTVNDIDESEKSEIALKYRAEFDMLTGVYNIQTYYMRAQELLEANPSNRYAVIRMDINRFKYINELFGIEEGDKLLRYIASVIGENVGENGVYGRLGGDIFCLFVSFSGEGELLDLAGRITAAVNEYHINYKLSPYFGICVVDDRRIPVSILCDWANLALMTVKGKAMTNVAFYDDKLRAKQLDERMIENSMDEALENKQFVVYLQPKHDIKSARVIGAEALARWRHPQEGFILPNRFIPLFESNGFIIKLDKYIWEETFRIMRSWIDKGYKPVPVSMNVSRMHIYDPSFIETVSSLADKYALPRKLIEFELTESTFIDNSDDLYSMMQSLKKDGFNLSMDDFGAGYSSLNMLKNAVVNTIKLDREFLNETAGTQKGRAVIQYTIELAKHLNMDVISEGVETEEQAKLLLDAGCSSAQGFYFSHPMNFMDFEKFVYKQHRNKSQIILPGE